MSDPLFLSPPEEAPLPPIEPGADERHKPGPGQRGAPRHVFRVRAFVDGEESAFKKTIKRMSMSYKGKLKYDDLDNLPPMEIDIDGYPIRPPTAKGPTRAGWTEDRRKVRFILIYNFTGGNETLACLEAGCTYRVYKDWLKTDKRFRARLKDAQREIGDRLQIRLAQSVGLMKKPADVVINPAILQKLLAHFKPGLFEEPEEPKNPPSSSSQTPDPLPAHPEPDVPRP